MQILIVVCSALLLAGNGPSAPAGADPGATVWAMLDAFQQRSESGYVGWMTDDFIFQSDDPDFRATSPSGMSRDAERRFAEHLFRGGANAPDGRPLPTAIRVDVSAGPMLVGAEPRSPGHATLRLDHLRAWIALSDSSGFEVGGTHNDIDLVLTEAGWRVSRWTETHASLRTADSLEQRLRQAAGIPGDSENGGVPSHLELTARPDRAHAAIVFDVGLPRAGGVLELFDVQGRKVGQRDLSGMARGRFRVALDGASYRAGVYWARVRQSDASITAKLVWAR